MVLCTETRRPVERRYIFGWNSSSQNRRLSQLYILKLVYTRVCVFGCLEFDLYLIISGVLVTETGPRVPGPEFRRRRETYSPKQVLELEKEFYFSQYLTLERRSQLACSLKLTEKQIKVWFQNRRMKLKKNSASSKNGFDAAFRDQKSHNAPILDPSQMQAANNHSNWL